MLDGWASGVGRDPVLISCHLPTLTEVGRLSNYSHFSAKREILPKRGKFGPKHGKLVEK